MRLLTFIITDSEMTLNLETFKVHEGKNVISESVGDMPPHPLVLRGNYTFDCFYSSKCQKADIRAPQIPTCPANNYHTEAEMKASSR